MSFHFISRCFTSFHVKLLWCNKNESHQSVSLGWYHLTPYDSVSIIMTPAQCCGIHTWESIIIEIGAILKIHTQTSNKVKCRSPLCEFVRHEHCKDNKRISCHTRKQENTHEQHISHMPERRVHGAGWFHSGECGVVVYESGCSCPHLVGVFGIQLSVV